MTPVAASPPPTQRTQSQKTQDAEKNLRRCGWISDNDNEILDCLSRLNETARPYSEGNAATRARKEEWQRVQWAAIYLKERFAEIREDEMVDRITQKVTEGIERRLGEPKPSGEVPDDLADGIANAIVTSFKNKLDSIAESHSTLKIQDETHFADVIGDQVKQQLDGPMKELEKKLEKVESSASSIAVRAHQRVNEAATKMEEATAKMKELEAKLMGTNGVNGALFGRWIEAADKLDTVVNKHGELNLTFAEALKVGAEARAEHVADKAVGNVLRAQHSRAILEADADRQKLVIRPRGEGDLGEKEERQLVELANLSLEEVGAAGAKNGSSPLRFVSARKIPGGALLYLASLEGVDWLKKEGKLAAWTRTWGTEISANFELHEVVAQMVPVSEDLGDEHVLREIKAVNSLDKGSLVKARWVKAPEARKAGTKYRYFVTEDPETWTMESEIQKDLFDKSWKDEVRERDEGWQRVERRGTGRLAGGPKGGGGGSQNTNKPIPTAPRNFGKQRTLDSFMTELGIKANKDGLTPEQLREVEFIEQQAKEEWARMEEQIRANTRLDQPLPKQTARGRPTSSPPSSARRTNPAV
ncbi:hypothetical protein BT96DRAFT_945580 [Gymnopus androsaceus JB14]|uniref:Uncharacterized protein n=1 Tax=Gymnopus androsaceus JB14 TaxID=1447944 RepID=A0A6A4GZ36_9AGAR|nr:hypothetical protein BT96DRAFT_945580 [Gymnopus androsaceus JB14]